MTIGRQNAQLTVRVVKLGLGAAATGLRTRVAVGLHGPVADAWALLESRRGPARESLPALRAGIFGTVETVAEVTVYEPTRRWAVRRAGGPVRPEVTYYLDPTPAGTRLRFTFDIAVLDGAARVLRPLVPLVRGLIHRSCWAGRPVRTISAPAGRHVRKTEVGMSRIVGSAPTKGPGVQGGPREGGAR